MGLAARARGGGDGRCGGRRGCTAVRLFARLRRSADGVPRVVVPGRVERGRRRGTGLLARLPHRRARARRELGRRARRPPGRAVARGEVAFITFHARAIRGAGDTGEAYFTVYAQKASPGWDKSLHEGLAVGADWQAFTLPFSWGAAYAATQASFVFGVGGRLAGRRDRRHPGDRLRPGVTLDMLPAAQFTLRRARRRQSVARRGRRPDRRDPEGRSRDRGRRRRTRGPGGRRRPRRAAAACLPVRLGAAGARGSRPGRGRGPARRQRRVPPRRRDAVQRRQPRERHQVAAMGRGLGPGVQPAADTGRARLDARPRHAHPRPRAGVARLEQPAAEPAAAARDARRGDHGFRRACSSTSTTSPRGPRPTWTSGT